jgi:hypothetical protein
MPPQELSQDLSFLKPGPVLSPYYFRPSVHWAEALMRFAFVQNHLRKYSNRSFLFVRYSSRLCILIRRLLFSPQREPPNGTCDRQYVCQGRHNIH